MKYELWVSHIGDGKLALTLDGVEFCDNLRTNILRQVIDTRDEQIKKALIALGWTPPLLTPLVGKKCIVKGCNNYPENNYPEQGPFVGGICGPCYRVIITGDMGGTESFIGILQQKARQLDTIKFQLRGFTKLVK